MKDFCVKKKTKSFTNTLNIAGFTVSEGWLIKFKKRYDIVFKKMCSKNACVGRITLKDKLEDGLKITIHAYFQYR